MKHTARDSDEVMVPKRGKKKEKSVSEDDLQFLEDKELEADE